MNTSMLAAKIEELKADLKISGSEIEKSLMHQPSIFDEVGELFATASANRDAMKAELEELDAQLGSNIRAEALSDGTKITESRIEELILLNPDHKQMMTDYINSKMIADKAQALRDSFSQRVSMLRDLVSLQTSGLLMGTPFRPDRSREESVQSRLAVARANRHN